MAFRSWLQLLSTWHYSQVAEMVLLAIHEDHTVMETLMKDVFTSSSSAVPHAPELCELLLLHEQKLVSDTVKQHICSLDNRHLYQTYFSLLARAFRTALAKIFVLTALRDDLDKHRYARALSEGVAFLKKDVCEDKCYSPMYMSLLIAARNSVAGRNVELYELLGRIETSIIEQSKWLSFAADKTSYTVSTKVVDAFIRELVCSEVGTSNGDEEQLQVKKYRKASSWILAKSFGRLSSLTAMTQCAASIYSSANGYSERLNIYENGADADNASLQQSLAARGPSLFDSLASLSPDQLTMPTRDELDTDTSAKVAGLLELCGNMDEFFIYATPELICRILTVEVEPGIALHIPIIPYLWDKSMEKTTFLSYAASMLHTILSNTFIVDTFSIIAFLILAKHYTGVSEFDLLLFVLWYNSQDVRKNFLSCTPGDLDDTPPSVLEPPKQWETLAETGDKGLNFYTFALHILSIAALSFMNPSFNSLSSASAYSDYIARSVSSSYCQNSRFSTVILSFLSDYCEKLKTLPDHLRIATYAEINARGGNGSCVTLPFLLNGAIRNNLLAIPYALALLLMKQGLRSVKKLTIDEPIDIVNQRKATAISRTSFLYPFLHVFDTLLVEPVCEAKHDSTSCFMANSYLQSLVRTGYLLDIYVLRFIFPQWAPGGREPTEYRKYRSINTMLALQNKDVLAFYINECKGQELVSILHVLHAHLNITFVLLYRTFREGPIFINEFLAGLIEFLEKEVARAGRLPIAYEIVLAIYEFSSSLPWVCYIKDAPDIHIFFPSDCTDFSDTRNMVTNLGTILSHAAVPNVQTGLHRMTRHIVHQAILSTGYYEKVSQDFLQCLFAHGTDPTFLVAILANGCMTKEVKGRILLSESAYAAATHNDKASETRATADTRNSSFVVQRRSPLIEIPEGNTFTTGIKIVTPTKAVPSSEQLLKYYTGSDRAEPLGYFDNYLCVLKIVRDLTLQLVDESKAQHRAKIRTTLKLITADCKLFLSPLPTMNSMLFEGGTVDADLSSWFITKLYLSLHQAAGSLATRHQALLAETVQLLKASQAYPEAVKAILPAKSLFTIDQSLFESLNFERLSRTVDAMQTVISANIWYFSTKNLSNPINPLYGMFTEQIGSCADRLSTLYAAQKQVKCSLDEAIVRAGNCQEQLNSPAICTDPAKSSQLLAYLQVEEKRKETLMVQNNTYCVNLTSLQQELQASALLPHVLQLINARESTLQLGRIHAALKGLLTRIRQFQEDRDAIRDWFLGGTGILSGPFTTNWIWLKQHIGIIYRKLTDPDEAGLSAYQDCLSRPVIEAEYVHNLNHGIGISMEELSEEGFFERKYIHARYYAQMRCLSSDKHSEQAGAAFEKAALEYRDRCHKLQTYRKSSERYLFKESFFTILNQESELFKLLIRATTPASSFQSLLTEYTNFFTPQTSSDIGMEFMSLSYQSIDPLWLQPQVTMDMLEKMEVSEDSITGILFLHGSLSRASEMYEQPLLAFINVVREAFQNCTASSQLKAAEMVQYYTLTNEYHAFKQINTFANPGYMGTLASGKVPPFYRELAVLTRLVTPERDSSTSNSNNGSGAIPNKVINPTKSPNTRQGISYLNMCHYYTQTTLLPMLYSLVPRYLFIHGSLKQYMVNKASSSLKLMPLLLMKPNEKDVRESDLQIGDSTSLPVMGGNSYSKLVSKCKVFGFLCGRVFASRAPFKQCFNPELLLLMATTAFSGMLLPDVITFCVSVASAMQETDAAAQVGMLKYNAVVFKFLDIFMSKSLLSDTLLNVSQTSAKLGHNTLLTAPCIAENPPETWDQTTIPRLLTYFFFSKLPQEMQEPVHRFLDQSTENLVTELRQIYTPIFERFEGKVQLLEEGQAGRTLETLLDHPITALKGRIDKVMHILTVGEGLFSANPNTQCVFREELKRLSYNYIKDLYSSSNFDLEQMYPFLYHVVRELPLASDTLANGVPAVKVIPSAPPPKGTHVHVNKKKKNMSANQNTVPKQTSAHTNVFQRAPSKAHAVINAIDIHPVESSNL